MLNTYNVREVWGSEGAPVMAVVLAPDATVACVLALRNAGYGARIDDDGDLVTSDDAPSVVAERVK